MAFLENSSASNYLTTSIQICRVYRARVWVHDPRPKASFSSCIRKTGWDLVDWDRPSRSSPCGHLIILPDVCRGQVPHSYYYSDIMCSPHKKKNDIMILHIHLVGRPITLLRTISYRLTKRLRTGSQSALLYHTYHFTQNQRNNNSLKRVFLARNSSSEARRHTRKSKTKNRTKRLKYRWHPLTITTLIITGARN